MAELVSLLTCTGYRPEALALCEKYVLRQTYRPLEWIIVNDETPIVDTDPFKSSVPANYDPMTDVSPLQETKLLSQRVANGVTIKTFRGPMPWKLGVNTQRTNMIEAMKHISKDAAAIAVIEDDDYYRPDYIEMQMYFLRKFDVVGQCKSYYYNIKERCYKVWPNWDHTSLCETVIRRSKLECLNRAVNSGQLFFDMAMYDIFRNEKHSHFLYGNIGIEIGIKGLPGKTGIGGGHHDLGGFTPDPFFNKLREWIPNKEDHETYINMMVGKK